MFINKSPYKYQLMIQFIAKIRDN